MEELVNELIKMNHRDFFDIIAILGPIILSAIIILQNIVYERRNNKLQKNIHNREWSQQYHNEILLLYNTYYEFCDIIFTSGFSASVEHGDVNSVMTHFNQLQMFKMNIIRRKNLARLLFERSNKPLFEVISKCMDNEITILDKYINYVASGNLYEASENAWNTIFSNDPIQKYNYTILQQDENKYNNFKILCNTDELQEIKSLLAKDNDLHSYDQYDKYFEEYFAIEKLE